MPTIRVCLGVAMEIEAKYYVSGADLEVLAGMRQLGPYVLVPVSAPELQENTYFDTADGRLTTARHGLRLRRIGERALITLKGPAEVGSDAVHRRAEFEFPGSNPRIPAAGLSASPVNWRWRSPAVRHCCRGYRSAPSARSSTCTAGATTSLSSASIAA